MSHCISRTPHTAPGTARPWPDVARRTAAVAREATIVTVGFLAYRQVRHVTSDELSVATANARRLVRFEESAGIFSERSVQALVIRHRILIDLLDRYYVTVHFSASFAFMAWVFLRHPVAWPRIRAWFAMVTAAGLAIHVAFPLAPPRMLAEHGFVDTLQAYGPRIYSHDVTASAANQLAAMPSLHFAWSVIVAVGVLSVRRSSWAWVVVLHPITTLLAIVATANHYWTDAAAGGVLVVLAVLALRVRTGEGAPVRLPRYAWRRTRFTTPTGVSPVPVVHGSNRTSSSLAHRTVTTAAGAHAPCGVAVRMSMGNGTDPAASASVAGRMAPQPNSTRPPSGRRYGATAE